MIASTALNAIRLPSRATRTCVRLLLTAGVRRESQRQHLKFHTRDSAVRGALMKPALDGVTDLPLGKMCRASITSCSFSDCLRAPAERCQRWVFRASEWQMDRWTGPSIFILGMPPVSCLSESSMCQWDNEKVSEWTRRTKIVAKGDGLRGFYSVAAGVKMADRWKAADGKSTFVGVAWTFSSLE